MKRLKYILLPLSFCYWLFTFVRNKLFDWGILKQTTFGIPLISVGNITVGGTGKTPHVQYLVEFLKDRNIATLSRGYKRKSKGFVLADEATSVAQLGDEPYLLKQRFPNLNVAVCEKRVEGVRELMRRDEGLQTVILDDAFQHRYVKPWLQILLVDYNRPIWKDFVFPAGFLREGTYAVKRADVVIISKCPQDFSEKEAEQWRKKLKLTNQELFFSTMEYGEAYDFFTKETIANDKLLAQGRLCVVTGIAQPEPLFRYIRSFALDFDTLVYPDHYNYSEKDRDILLEKARTHKIITTEKDVYKLADILPESTELFVLPIMPKILFGQATEFEQLLRR